MKEIRVTPITHRDEDPDEEQHDSFDWENHVALCIEPAPNSPVYDMTFSEFARYRGEQWDSTGGEKARVGFRLPPEISNWVPRLSRRHNLHATRYISLSMELGLIIFQKEYHDTYSGINARMDELFYSSGDNVAMLNMAGQVHKQTIALGSGSRGNKMYMPYIPAGVGDAISGTASEINCSKSDMVFVCTCLGIQIDAKERPLPSAFMLHVNATIDKFSTELDMLDARTRDVYNKLLCSSVTV